MRPALGRLVGFVAAALAALVAAPLASAHVSVHPNALPAGAETTIVVRVPNEEATANTTKVDVKFPPGVLSASYEKLPGWTATIINRKLAKPVTTMEGETVTQEVDRVVWSGGKLPPGQYLDFPLSVLVPEDAKGLITFKALQIYDTGKVVRWIGAPDAEQPAPRVFVTGKDARIADYGETPTSTPTTTPASNVQVGPVVKSGDSETRANVAIVIGAVGIAAGLLALGLALARRPRTA